ncbi:Sorting nexin MVP1 [Lachancea thermotolerans]
MSLYDDLEDPWRSEQPTSSSHSASEWTGLNVDPLAGSDVLPSGSLISGINTMTLDSGLGNSGSLPVGSSTLLSAHPENSMEGAWSDSLDEANHRVSNDLNRGEMVAGVPFQSENPHSTEESGKEDYEVWSDGIRKAYNPLAPDIITVEEIPEREGLLFKHTNYLVKHLVELPDTEPSSDRSVIRRYSDFVWLQEVLLKKYPFRMIPDLPPKRIGSHSSDPIFLIKRRNGLSRFINIVVKHPVFKKDDLVLTFLTVPTDLLGWRKQASYDTSDEFTDRKIEASFIKMWRKDMAERWNQADASIDGALELWAKITVLVDRCEKRLRFIAQDRSMLASMLDSFSDSAPQIFASDDGTLLDIKNHLGIVSKHLTTCNNLVKEENMQASSELSPRFRTFTDVLLSLKGLFERYKIMAGNNVPQLQRRIEVNTDRLEQMKDKPDLKGAEYDRVKQSIQRDRKSIAEQMNRSWLVRKCILEEYVYFQETQFLVSDVFQRWVKLNMTFNELNTNEWEKLLDHVQAMPSTR